MFAGRIGTTEIIIIAALIILLFGFKKLPDAARSIGRSMRVFKSEMDELRADGSSPQGGQGASSTADEPPAVAATRSASV